jgi:hypothetical protein
MPIYGNLVVCRKLQRFHPSLAQIEMRRRNSTGDNFSNPSVLGSVERRRWREILVLVWHSHERTDVVHGHATVQPNCLVNHNSDGNSQLMNRHNYEHEHSLFLVFRINLSGRRGILSRWTGGELAW